MNSIREVATFLLQYADYTLFSHVSPDGDTLGSVIALAKGLERLGKSVQLVCEDPVPHVYAFLDGADRFIRPEDAVQTSVAVSVDCADLKRVGTGSALFEGAEHTLVIDHHMTNPLFGQMNLVQETGATGEIIYLILKEMGVTVDAELAVPLYTAIAADTGNFAFSNASCQSFTIAGALKDTGFDLPGTNRLLFRTFPFRRIRLRGRVLSKAALYHEDKVAVATITREDFELAGASSEDAEGFIDDLRDVETVEIAAVLKESEDGGVRVSLRGKSYADVSRIAVRFGGGGHKLAAGCTIYDTVDAAARQVIEAAGQLLREGNC